MRSHIVNTLAASVAMIWTAATPCICSAADPAADAGMTDGSSLPEAWNYTAQFTDSAPDTDHWWRRFGDPVLDSLVATGLDRNYDVRAAASRIRQARAAMGRARAGFFPSVGVSAGWQREQTSGRMAGHSGRATAVDYFSAGATMSWEIDIFGKIASQVKGSRASWRASKAEYDATMVSLAAEIATTYIQLRVWQAQLVLAREHIENQGKIVHIAEVRHETGLSSALDVAQARTVYYSTVATIPPLVNSIHKAVNSLATLLATRASDLPADVTSATAPLPDYNMVVATGIPADLLRRRPDIIEAEQQVEAAAAALGVARKDYLPSLTINGSISTSAHRAADLFGSESLGYSIVPTLSWTLFDGLARRNAVAEARAEMEAACDSYNMTVATAIAETDNAMNTYLTAIHAIGATNDVVANSRRSLELSLELYKSGNTAFRDVADAQMSYLEYATDLLTARGNALTALIDLYRALGGCY